jgi:hypothetical protein
MIIDFPDTKVDHQIEDAMEELGNWVEVANRLRAKPYNFNRVDGNL